MTSLAVFPKLRRTITDVMEDELYHVPSFNNSHSMMNNSQSSNNVTLNNSWKHSPILSHAKLHFKNTSAFNSEELLTIPDTEAPSATMLSKIPSHDMYYDVPENLPEDFNTIHSHTSMKNIFNEFADPTLTTTIGDESYAHGHVHHNLQTVDQSNPNTSSCTKLLKFNDDLTLDYFTNEDDSKFVIFPGAMSPNLIPEEIEDEELSEDEDEDMMNFSYLDDNNALQQQQYQYQIQQQQQQVHQIQPHHLQLNQVHNGKEQVQEYQKQKQEQIQNRQDNTNVEELPHKSVHDTEDTTVEIDSDVDKMSLASFQEYSSDSSVIDEDEEEDDESVPNYYSNHRQQPQANHRRSSSTGLINNGTTNIFAKSKKQRQLSISNSSMIPKDSNQHQCHLINPSNGKTCGKQFSRPYDLIRHQETIHASRKKIFRCLVCNQLEGGLSKKTFSRGDALSRHVRVKHGLSGIEATNAIQYAKDHVEYL